MGLEPKGYSHQNEQANKRWTLTAAIAFFTFNLNPASEKQTLFGTEINPENVYLVLTVLLSLTTIVYVVAHVGAYRTARMFQKVCQERGLNKLLIGGEFTFADHLHSHITSNYNRVWPLFSWIKRANLRKSLYKPVKVIVDTVQISVSPAAIIFILPELKFGTPFEIAAWIAALVAVLSSVMFWFQSMNYIFKVEG